MGICVKRKGETMKCPHCQVTIHPQFVVAVIGQRISNQPFIAKNVFGISSWWQVRYMACPGCGKGILALDEKTTGTGLVSPERFIVPKSSTRHPAAPEVPKYLAEDFDEACLVLTDSPKASAALSRRCLQGLLKDRGYDNYDLAKAIDAVLETKTLPHHVATSVDAIRVIGNFAAHPLKHKQSGEILPVEPEEASWNLDVLESLFDFYYIGPAKEQAKIDAMNAKLLAAGKLPMK